MQISNTAFPVSSKNQPARLILSAQGGGEALPRRNPGFAITIKQVGPEGTVRHGCSQDLNGPYRTDTSLVEPSPRVPPKRCLGCTLGWKNRPFRPADGVYRLGLRWTQSEVFGWQLLQVSNKFKSSSRKMCAGAERGGHAHELSSTLLFGLIEPRVCRHPFTATNPTA
jgi:hypothetical protein